MLKLRTDIPVTDFMEALEEDWENVLWPNKVINIVLISGKAGVGKTTLALALYEYLKTKSPLVVGESFATGVKLIAKECFHWNGAKDKKGRKLLQDIGNLGREVDLNFWAGELMDRVFSSTGDLPPDFIIIDDWRFPNEAHYFVRFPEEFKVIRIKIKAPERESLKGSKEYFDISETSLDNYQDFEIELENNLDTSFGEFTSKGVETIKNYLGIKEE